MDGNNTKPSANDFDVYLPWACKQLQVHVNVVITRIVQNDYIAVTDRSVTHRKSKGRVAHSRTEVGSDQEKEERSGSTIKKVKTNERLVKILTTYDPYDNLVQIKFAKNRFIPRSIIKIIGLIVPFQPNLNSLTINQGLDGYCVHEIRKILSTSHITDLNLDNTYIESANYHILLEKANYLQKLSLARCKVGDENVQKIAYSLANPLPASKTLSVLNLSSNRITDAGVQYIAEAMRSNRQLVYLNLSDNRITDKGASEVLNVLSEFPLTAEELIASRQRYMTYLKKKTELVGKMLMELRTGNDGKTKKKTYRPSSSFPVKKMKGLEKEPSLKSCPDTNRSLINIDASLIDKAEVMAENALGPFADPFSKTNTVSKDCEVYCHGNNVLCYLNLSYNNLTIITLKNILNVLKYQKTADRKPRGVINVSVEGNNLPVSCKELAQIDDILEQGLFANRKYSGGKKRPITKSGKY